MNDYRIVLEGEAYQFVVYVKAETEYHAKEEIQDRYPTWVIMEIVEVMPCITH